MDEAEIELKFEAVLIDADNWWDNLEQEERVEIYVKETKDTSPEQDVPNSQDGNVTEPTSIKDVQTIEGRPDNTDEKQIKSDIPEREFMEGCLNQSLQLNQDMTLAIALYGLSKSWNIDKLIFLINECRKDKELENEKDK